MSFTSAQKTKLKRILGVGQEVLDHHLDVITLTAEDETEIGTLITSFDTYRSNSHVSIEPNVRNFGARLTYQSKLNEIRAEIASIMEFDQARLFSDLKLVRG